MSYGAMMAVARSRENPRNNQPEGNTRRYEHEPVRSGYDRPRNNEPRYEPRYDGGYNARMGGEYADGGEMAFRDRRGRRHYDNGRFAPMRSEMDDDDDGEDMNGIGFIRGGDRVQYGGYGDERRRVEQGREMGHASVYEAPGGGWGIQGVFGGERHGRSADRPMDETMAHEWARRMRNDDGSTGPHWSMDQIQQLVQQRRELQDYEPAEVFAVMNMMYSDYAKVAKKFNANNMDFYVCMAKAWLDDPDAGAGKMKTARYYECVVK